MPLHSSSWFSLWRVSVFAAAGLAAQACLAQTSSSSAAQAGDAKTQSSVKDAAPGKKKPKKVWTEDDIAKVGGTISVVGDTSTTSGQRTPSRTSAVSGDGEQRQMVNHYRDQVRQLQTQLDATEKKIQDLRNFKADNASPSGGINPNHGYSMTPIADQIKQLEEKKKQIQDKMDIVMDEARKKGIESGELR